MMLEMQWNMKQMLSEPFLLLGGTRCRQRLQLVGATAKVAKARTEVQRGKEDWNRACSLDWIFSALCCVFQSSSSPSAFLEASSPQFHSTSVLPYYHFIPYPEPLCNRTVPGGGHDAPDPCLSPTLLLCQSLKVSPCRLTLMVLK